MWNLQTYKASWLESFDILKTDSIKLLLLVSLRTLLNVYRSFFHAWFLPVTLLVGLVLTLPRLLGAFYTTLIARASRPSLNYKNASYWQQTVFTDWIIFCAVLALTFAPQLWPTFETPNIPMTVISKGYELLVRIFFLGNHSWLPGTGALGILPIFLSPFIIIWVLFMLDARTNFFSLVKALGRAILMMAYNYPFFLIIYAILRGLLSLGYLVTLPLAAIIPYFTIFGWVLLLGVVVPYYICLLTNFYVKRIHEQFSLYYGK